MALTRVTSTVLESNAVSAEKLANGTIVTRHFANSSILLEHLGSTSNFTTQINTVHANVETLKTNVNSVASNVGAVISNVNTVSNNVAVQAANTIQNKANIAIVSANTIQLQINMAANVNSVKANVDAAEANIAGILDGTTFTGEVIMSDDLIVTGNLIVNGDTTTANSINMVVQDRMLMLANSATGAPAADVGVLFNRGNQGNAAFFYDESGKTFKVSDTKDPSTNVTLSPVTSANLDVGILTAANIKYTGTDVHVSIVDNVAALTTVDTALQARITANSTAFQAEDTALQARITANNTLLHSNDFITFTRLNANLNVVSANVDSGVGLVKKVNSAVSTGSSNVFFVATPTAAQKPSDIDKVDVFIDGIRQRPDSLTGSNHDFVYSSADASVTITDPSLPSGLIVVIDALCPRP